MTHASIEVAERPPQHTAVVCGHASATALPEFLGGVFGEVMQRLAEQHIAPAGPPFARYRPTGDGFDVEAGFPTTADVSAAGRVVPSSLPGGTVVCAVHTGGYSGVAETYEQISEWLPAHGYTVAGAPWESYLDEPQVAQPRTLVAFPVHAG